MSTADDAWQEWREEIHGPIGEFRDSPMTTKKTAFMAGYRRALEDAADALQVIADGIPRTETDSNAYARMCAYDNAAKTCRDRAAGVGTKDGDDDE